MNLNQKICEEVYCSISNILKYRQYDDNYKYTYAQYIAKDIITRLQYLCPKYLIHASVVLVRANSQYVVHHIGKLFKNYDIH